MVITLAGLFSNSTIRYTSLKAKYRIKKKPSRISSSVHKVTLSDKNKARSTA